MEEKLKAREKVLKPVENYQSQLSSVEEEDSKHRKELDKITNEIFTLMLHLELALDHEKSVNPVAKFENALNEATAVSSKKHVRCSHFPHLILIIISACG